MPDTATARSTVLSATFVVLLGICGCNAQGPERVPVSGRVTYGGGEWPAAGVLNFCPLEPAEGSRHGNGTATIDRSGNYVARSPSNAAAGLFPGTYRINIECWKSPPTMGGPPAVSYVAEAILRGDDRLVMQVTAGSPLIYNFDVPAR